MNEQKHTPGPWRWYGSPKSGFYLATERHGRRIVMEFERLGMQGAQPTFQVDGLMVAGSELCNFEVAPEIVGMTEAKKNRRRVYRYDITGFNHPDAHLIAAAPDMLAALESICTEISGGLCMNYTGATGICPNAAKGKCAVWDAIQKAKGTQQ